MSPNRAVFERGSNCENADTVLAPLSEDVVALLGLIGLLMLMVVGRGAIREVLRRIAEALHDEWQRPR